MWRISKDHEEYSFASLDQSILLEHFSINDIRFDGEARYADIPGVTMVFDLAGSSASIRQNGPRDYVDRYARIFDQLTTTLYQYDGIIEKFPGDGISSHFLKKTGENTLENARNRAVRTAVSIRDYMKQENLGNSFRICMWSGEDTIATVIGNGFHNELISVGNGVNIAHKIEKHVKEANCVIGMDINLAREYQRLGKQLSCQHNLPTDLSANGENWYGVLNDQA
jgi:hypothetical protein